MAGFEVTPMGDPTGGHFPLGVSPSPPRSVPAKVGPRQGRPRQGPGIPSPEEDSSRVSGRSENRTGHHSG